MALIKYEILYEDADILVCYKPAGLAVQTKRLGQQDLETQLKNYLVRKKEKPYVGVVHRLDQPVEGVMVFGKNPKAMAGLSKQVQSREIGKYYYAVGAKTAGTEATEAEPANAEPAVMEASATTEAAAEATFDAAIAPQGTLIDYLTFDQKSNTGAVSDAGNPNAKKAVLDYKLVWAGKRAGSANTAEEEDIPSNATSTQADVRYCFDIHLHTGRHHQIRLQLAHLGYPLVGDVKYGGLAGGQLALCSYRICFEHPTTRKRMEFTMKPRNPEFSECGGNFH